MTIKVADRVKEITNSIGSGAIELTGASSSFQSFGSVLSSGDKTYYCIQNSTQFEIGRGTYTNNTLSRDLIFDSSDNGNKINIGSQSEVFIGYPASGSIYKDDNDRVDLGSGGIKFSDGSILTSATTVSVTGSPEQVMFFGDDSSYAGSSSFTYSSGDNLLTIGDLSATSGLIQMSGGTYPHLRLAGSNSVNPINLNIIASGTGTALAFDGNEGRLFKIEDNLSSGTIFKISDISGLSLIEADASGDVKLINGGRYVGVANDSPSYPLDVSGIINTSSGVRFADGTFQSSAASGDIATVSGLTVTNANQIAVNTGDIASVSGLTVTNANSITANTSQIAVNTGDIASVSGLTVTNASNIAATGATNASNIAAVSGLLRTAGTGLVLVGTELHTSGTGTFDMLDMTLLDEANYPPHKEGRLFYDSDNHTISLYNDESDVTLQLGQEQFLRVRNKTGGTIYNGSGVRINGSHGASAPTIDLAIASTEEKSQVVGLATHNIENNSFGYVTTYGIVRDVNTAAFSAGDELFLDASASGNLTNVSPTIPNYKVVVGHVIRSHAANGSILVQVGHSKLGGGDLKSESPLNISGVPFVTSIADTTAGGAQTDPLFVYDSGNKQLQLGSGLQLLDGVPANTGNVLYNLSGDLYFNGSAVGGSVTGVPSGIAFFGSDSGITSAGSSLDYDDSVSQIVKLESTEQLRLRTPNAGINMTKTGSNYINVTDSNGNEKFDFGDTYFRARNSQTLGLAANRWGIVYADQIDQEIGTATDVGHVIKGASSQTADLAQYQNSAGTVMTRIESDGSINASGNITASGTLFATTVQGTASTLNIYNGTAANRIKMGASDTTFYRALVFTKEIKPSTNNESDVTLGSTSKRFIESHITTGTFYEAINSSGLVTAATGVALQRNTPATTADKLYNVGGALYFNGSAVGGSESDTLQTVTDRGASTDNDITMSGALLFAGMNPRIGTSISASDPGDRVIRIGYRAGNNVAGADHSIMIGTDAGQSIASGNTNIIAMGVNAVESAKVCGNTNAIGNEAGYQSSGISYSNIIGWRAGYTASDSIHANLMGYQAGNQMKDSDHVVAIGYETAVLNSGSHYGVNVGYQAGRGLTSSNYAVNIGRRAGKDAGDGDHQTNIGFNAGTSAGSTSTAGHIAIGTSALEQSDDIAYTVAIGSSAGKSNPAACSYSVLIGPSAGYAMSGGKSSVYIGYYAGRESDPASATSENVAIGQSSLYKAESYKTTAVGYSAGDSASGVHGLFLGHQAGRNAHGRNNMEIITSGPNTSILNGHQYKLNIENSIVGDTDDGKFNIGKDLGSGDLSPDAHLSILSYTASNIGLSVKGAASQSADLAQYQNSAGTVMTRIESDGSINTSGNITATGTITATDTIFADNGVDTSIIYNNYTNRGRIDLTSSSSGPSVTLLGGGSTIAAFGTEQIDFENPLNSTGLITAATGVALQRNTPATTTDKLYNVGGDLYFNGSAVGGSESDTLQTVTDRGASTDNDITISGNLLFGDNITNIGFEAGSSSTFNSPSVNIGYYAGQNITDAIDKIVNIGYYAGKNYGGGQDSINIGTRAGYNGSGTNNIHIGEFAGESRDAAEGICIGMNAGIGASTASMIAIGKDSSKDVIGTAAHVAIGYLAAKSTSGVSQSVAIGQNAINSTHDAGYSVAIGPQAAQSCVGIASSVAIGRQALYGANDGAAASVAIGAHAGYAPTDSLSSNVMIGYNARRQSEGSVGVAIGYQAGYQSQAAYSIMIGRDAGRASSGNSNILLGYRAGYNLDGASNIEIVTGGPTTSILNGYSNKLNIEDSIVGDTADGKFNIGQNLGSGDLSPDAHLSILSSSASNVGLSVKGAASQSADLAQYQNNAGTVITSIDSDGDITSREFVANSGGNVTGVFRVNNETYLQIGAKSNSNVSILSNNSERVRVASNYTYLTTTIPFGDAYTLGTDGSRFSTIYGKNLDLSQDLSATGLITAATGVALQRNTPATTTDKLYNVGGALYFNGSAVGGSESDTLQTVTDRGSVTTNAINVSGITLESTTIDNGELNSSGDFSFSRAGSEKMRLAGNGAVNVYTALYPGSDTAYNLGYSSLRWANGYFDQLDQEIHTATDVGHILKGAASQSADLAQYQNSAGTVMTKIESDGSINTSGNITASGEINVADNDRAGNGGSVRFGNNAYLASSTDSEIYMGIGSQEYLSLMSDRYSLRSGSKYAWSNNNAPNSAYDTALARVSAGVVSVIDGSDDYGTLYAETVNATGHLYGGDGTHSSSYTFNVNTASVTNALAVNESNGRVGINTSSLNGVVNIGGDRVMNFNGGNANIRSDGGNLYLRAGGGSYSNAIAILGDQIRFGDFDAGAQYQMRTAHTARRTFVLQKLTSQSADIFNVRDENADPYFVVDADGGVSSTGLITAATGITLQRNTPATTTDKLYNIGGSLYFNGSAVGGGGTLAVADGGTNTTSFADKSVIISQDSGDDTLAAAQMDGNGELLIGGTSGPAVANMTSSGGTIAVTNGDGTISIDTAGGSPSDERLKKNIKSFKNPLEKLCKLEAIEFDWNEEAKKTFEKEGSDIGLIAQDVEKVVPEVIGENRDYKTIEYDKLTTLLIGAVKELKQEVLDLTDEIKKLKS